MCRYWRDAMNIASGDRLASTQLCGDHAAAVDSRQWDLWPEFFTGACV